MSVIGTYKDIKRIKELIESLDKTIGKYERAKERIENNANLTAAEKRQRIEAKKADAMKEVWKDAKRLRRKLRD